MTSSIAQKYFNEAGKKILIVMDQGIGNMIMLTPALKTIKEHIPNSKITVLGKQPALQVISNWYVVEKTISALDNDSYDICFLSIWSGDYEDRYLDKLKKQCKQIIKMSIGNLDVHETKHHLEIAVFLGCGHTDIKTYCSSIDVDIPLPRDKKTMGILVLLPLTKTGSVRDGPITKNSQTYSFRKDTRLFSSEEQKKRKGIIPVNGILKL